MLRTLNVSQIVGTDLCVASEDGHKLHDEIAHSLTEGQSVALNFKNVRRLTTAFLNVAIGQLYNEFSEEMVRRHLRVEDLDQQGLSLLKKVIDRAKEFYSGRTN